MSKKRRILIAAGGTGGHLLPAQALAEALEGSELLFVGGGLDQSRFFQRSRYAYQSIASGPLTPKGVLRLGKGVLQSVGILRRFQPHLVVGFGSFHTAPVLAAAVLTRSPYLLHEGNAFPGRVNRLFSRWAKLTGVGFLAACNYLKGRCEQVALPLRPGYQAEQMDTANAREHFGLDPNRSTILIFGGSQGAVWLNAHLPNAVPAMTQVLHLTGDHEQARQVASVYRKRLIPAVVKPFEERMDIAWSAATVAVTRAGASSLTEQLAMEVPGLLIPYPFATNDHQTHNARFVTETIRGAMTLAQDQATPEQLAYSIDRLLAECAQMRQALQNHKETKIPELQEVVCRIISSV